MEKNNTKRLLTGVVVSAGKMQKTVTVVVKRTYPHPKVGKIVASSRKFQVHDPSESAHVGDVVEFFEGRPISKTKYMHFHRVVSSAAGVKG